MKATILLLNLENIPISQLNEAYSFLTEKEKQKYNSFPSESRKLQFLSIRLLTYKYKKISETIKYTSNGKPYLNCCQISISHSAKYAAIAFSHKPVGIDLEQTNRNFTNVKKRYLSPLDPNTNDNKKLALIWTAKEAIYKLYGKRDISFKNNITVRLPEKISKNGSFSAKILLSSHEISISLSYYQFKGHFITLAQYQ